MKLSTNKLHLIILLFLSTILVTIISLNIFTTKTPSLRHHITFHSSLSVPNKDLLDSILKNHSPSSDLTISSKISFQKPTAKNHIITNIYVPVTDFKSPKYSINSTDQSIKYIPIQDLTPAQKLLAIDGHYFLDNFDSGAKFEFIIIDGQNPDPTIDLLRATLLAKNSKFPEKSTTLSLIQTGVTALARKLNTKFKNQNFSDTFSSQISNFLQSADLTHLSNEISFANNCNTGPTSTTLCASPESLKILQNTGVDIIELTGNHNNDYGASNNIETIAKYHENNIKTFGGGKNLSAAKKPLEFSQKSTNLTLLGYNHSTSSVANGQIATENSPGANPYDEETAKNDIKTAKSKGHMVVVSIQFFECYSYPALGTEMPECDKPIKNQTAFFRHLIDLGADIVIGTQAHQPQTYEIYHQKPIFYGLGNLFFDQSTWPGTSRSLILTHYFYNQKYLQTKITPTYYGPDFTTKLLDPKSAELFLTRLSSAKTH